MVLQKERALPVLRFPEFIGDWNIKKGSQLFKNKRAKGNADLPIYSVTLDRGLVPRDSMERRIGNDADANKNLQANPQDLVYNMMRMWQGAVGICYQDCMVSPAYVILSPKQGVDSEFFNRLLQNKRYLYLLGAYSYGLTSDRLRLYFKDFAAIKFKVPTLPEQQKIAQFLTTIDTRIQQLSRKVELLEQYKKGVMQRIFSQELRFRDEAGKGFPDWEEKAFGKIFKFHRTNSLSRKQLNSLSGKARNIHYGDIHTKYQPLFAISNESEVPFINEEIVDLKKVAKEDFCLIGDLIVADASEDYKDIGKAIEIIELDNETVLAGLHTILARDEKGKTVVGFKAYLMQSREVRMQIMRFATGISVLGISKTNLAKIKIKLPSTKEQKKITEFLSTLDKKITQTKQQLNHLQTYKKGLLQQLFV